MVVEFSASFRIFLWKFSFHLIFLVPYLFGPYVGGSTLDTVRCHFRKYTVKLSKASISGHKYSKNFDENLLSHKKWRFSHGADPPNPLLINDQQIDNTHDEHEKSDFLEITENTL